MSAVNGVVSSSSTVNTVGGGFFLPSGVAVDSADNVFVADFANLAVYEIVAVNGVVSSSSPVKTLGSSFNSNPSGVAVDGAGNVFVASDNGAVQEIDFADEPSLSFPATAAGSTGSDSPQTVTLTNNGNAPLTFEVPTTGLNPAISTGFTFGNSSTCPQLSTSYAAGIVFRGPSPNGE